jgi:mannan endo-1,6-alpha-mannosidase
VSSVFENRSNTDNYEQMAALSVIGANMITAANVPLTNSTGGTSLGDPDAGSTASTSPIQAEKPITTSDKAGAAILTLLASVGVIGGAFWINVE